MLEGQVVNIIRIVCLEEKNTINIIDLLKNNNNKVDFNKIIPLKEDNEQNRLEQWEQINNANVKELTFNNNEVLLKLNTILIPPYKIMKHLSLNKNIKEIILSYAFNNLEDAAGVCLIRRGGIMYETNFEEKTIENKNFSEKLIQQFYNDKIIDFYLEKEELKH